ncbi:MAG: hypothetical protein EZS28_005187, partial [Streblomastix strix]
KSLVLDSIILYQQYISEKFAPSCFETRFVFIALQQLQWLGFNASMLIRFAACAAQRFAFRHSVNPYAYQARINIKRLSKHESSNFSLIYYYIHCWVSSMPQHHTIPTQQ